MDDLLDYAEPHKEVLGSGRVYYCWDGALQGLPSSLPRDIYDRLEGHYDRGHAKFYASRGKALRALIAAMDEQKATDDMEGLILPD